MADNITNPQMEDIEFEKKIETYVKENCKDALDIIKGAKNIKIILEQNHPQTTTLNKIGFTKNGKNYILQMDIGTTFDPKEITGQTKRGDGSIQLSYEQLIHMNTHAKIVDADKNQTVWDSRTYDKNIENIEHKGLDNHAWAENINVAKAAYVISAFRAECTNQNIQSKILSSIKNLRAEGYQHKQFRVPEYTEERR